MIAFVCLRFGQCGDAKESRTAGNAILYLREVHAECVKIPLFSEASLMISLGFGPNPSLAPSLLEGG